MELARTAFPVETPEPDLDARGNLSPRALGHGVSIRSTSIRVTLGGTCTTSSTYYKFSTIVWSSRLSPEPVANESLRHFMKSWPQIDQ